MDTSISSAVLTGVVPSVCDAEAGQDHIITLTRSSTSIDGPSQDRPRPAPSAEPHVISVRRLRSLMMEVCAAIRSALDNERGTAEDSLRRATEILAEIDTMELPQKEEVSGGLAPWQIRKVAAHVEAHLDRSIGNAELATLVRLNASHFGRAFRNSFGEPPHEYVIRRRVERAQGLMLSTNAPLSEIALDCGLADQSHLTRLFRRIVGESPRAWRRARISAPA